MIFRSFLTGLALVVAVPALAQKAEPAQPLTPLADAIAARDTGFAQAFNAGRIADAVDFYEDDALLLVPGEPPMQGEKAIANVLAGLAKTASNLALSPAVFRALADDYALEVGVISYETPGDNGTTNVVKQKYQAIWHRGDDSVWRLASFMMDNLAN